MIQIMTSSSPFGLDVFVFLAVGVVEICVMIAEETDFANMEAEEDCAGAFDCYGAGLVRFCCWW